MLLQTKDEVTQHIRANYQANVWKRTLDTNLDIPSLLIIVGRQETISSLLTRWKISQPQNQRFNLLLARAVNQITRPLISVKYFQWSALMHVNVEGFVETLFMIQSKVIEMRLKRTMKTIMLATMLRIFDTDYQTLCLIVWFILVI